MGSMGGGEGGAFGLMWWFASLQNIIPCKSFLFALPKVLYMYMIPDLCSPLENPETYPV